MSKFFVIVIMLICRNVGAAEGLTMVVIHREGGDFFARKSDKTGLTREYKISNVADFSYDCLRSENKKVSVTGEFKEFGKRSGSLQLKSVGEEIVDPLEL